MKSIILLHGAIGARDQLEPLANQLTKKEFKVFSFSFSGHGKEPFDNDFGIMQFSRELENFIIENNLNQPQIFGYSMGGYVALFLASQKPHLIGSIITLGTKFNWTKEISENEIKQLDPKIISEKVPKFAEALKARHGYDWELLLKRTAEMMISLGNHNLINTELLKKIENKVMIGLASNDSMVSIEETDFVFSHLKNAQRYTLSNAKHPIETVDSKVLADIIVRFLQ